MNEAWHPEDEDLILFHYGEAVDPRLEGHLEGCAACRRRHQHLVQVLQLAGEAPVPERGADYGETVWRRLRPRLSSGGSRIGRVGLPLALAASLVLAFLLGRHYPPGASSAPISSPVRERIFLVMVGDHLERSEMVLVELSHAGPASMEGERLLAQELVRSNRLFRQTAVKAGETGVGEVLDELERVLVEVGNSPEHVSVGETKALQRRIEGLLFRIRVVGSHVKQRERDALPAAVS
jgi:hypothetical protein